MLIEFYDERALTTISTAVAPAVPQNGQLVYFPDGSMGTVLQVSWVVDTSHATPQLNARVAVSRFR